MADQKPSPQQYQTPLGPMSLDELVNRAAQASGVDAETIRQMTHQEDPKRDPGAVSPKGAVGFMQVMPDSYFRKGGRDDYRSDISWVDPATNQRRTGVNIHDPYENVMGGAAYFKSLLDRYGGDRTKALAAYNAGPKPVDQYGGVPPFKETKDYVSKIEGKLGPETQQQPAIAQQQQPAIAAATGGAAGAAPAPAIAQPPPDPWARFQSLRPAGPPEAGAPPFATGVVPGAQPPAGQLPDLGQPTVQPAISAQMGVPRIAVDPRTGATSMRPAQVAPGQQIPPELWRQAQRQAIEQTRPVIPPITAPYGSPEYNTQLIGQLEARANLSRWQQENQGTLSRVLNTIGDIVAPNIMARVPGTEMYREAQGKAAQEQADRLQQLQIEQEKLRVQRSQFISTRDGVVRFDPVSGQTSYLTDAQGNRIYEEKGLDDFIGASIAAGDTPETNPRLATAIEAQRQIKTSGSTPFAWAQQNMLPIIDKLEKYGYPTDDANLRASADTAYQNHQISQPEHTTVSFGLGFGQSPAARVEVSGAQLAQKDLNKWYWGPDGQPMRGRSLPKEMQATAVPIESGSDQDMGKVQGEAKQVDVIAQAFNTMAKDTNWNIFDNAAANSVITKYLTPDEAVRVGLLVEGTGGQINVAPHGAVGKIANKILLQSAVPEKLRSDVEKFLVDYYFLKDMAMTTQQLIQDGKIGRGNAGYYEAMVDQLPGPNSADSRMAIYAMSRTRQRLAQVGGELGALPQVRLDTIGTGRTNQPDGTMGKTKDGKPVKALGGYWIPQ